MDQNRAQWADRAQFFAIAARMMRRVLVESARQHLAVKREGTRKRVTLDDQDLSLDERADLLVALDEALERLAAVDERAGRVVECRFFGGLSEAETASALGISQRTVAREWVTARGWLYQELRRD